MARNGKPPRSRRRTRCRACPRGENKAMNDGLFCVDHELLWIAKAGVTSNDLQKKHGKMYRQFLKQQLRAVELERLRHLEENRQKIKRIIDNEAVKIHNELNGMKTLTGVGDVYKAALYSLGEHAEVTEDRNLVLVLDNGAEGRAPSSDWRLSTSAYEPAGEGQSEVPAADVHRSGK